MFYVPVSLQLELAVADLKSVHTVLVLEGAEHFQPPGVSWVLEVELGLRVVHDWGPYGEGHSGKPV